MKQDEATNSWFILLFSLKNNKKGLLVIIVIRVSYPLVCYLLSFQTFFAKTPLSSCPSAEPGQSIQSISWDNA